MDVDQSPLMITEANIHKWKTNKQTDKNPKNL